MNAVLRITHIDVRPLRQDNSTLEIVLENAGLEPLESGILLVHEILTDGSGQRRELCMKSLCPGERIYLLHSVPGSIKEINFISYRSADGATANLSGLLSWWQSPWSLKAA